MKLYLWPGSRSDRPQWVLEEMSVEYEQVFINLYKNEQRSTEYLKLHPLGKVPLLEDDGTYILESGAICTYLADKYPEKNLAPQIGTKERASYYQWLFYTTATIEPIAVEIVNQLYFLPDADKSDLILKTARQRLLERVAVIDNFLKDKPFLLGNKISAADIMLCGTLLWDSKTLSMLPAISSYINRLTDSPAYDRIKKQRDKYQHEINHE